MGLADFFHVCAQDEDHSSEIQRFFTANPWSSKVGLAHGRRAVMAALAEASADTAEEESFETPSDVAAEMEKPKSAPRCSALIMEGSFDLLNLLGLQSTEATSVVL